MGNPLTHTPIEVECIALETAWEMIDGMVNHQLLTPPSNGEVKFYARPHTMYFLTLLSDFLSPPSDRVPETTLPRPAKDAPQGVRRTILPYLRNSDVGSRLVGDRSKLNALVSAMSDWMEKKIIVEEVNFACLGKVVDVELSRLDLLKLVGDRAKHNPSRLGGAVKKYSKLFDSVAPSSPNWERVAALLELADWVLDYAFYYLSHQVVEWLNNLRSAIFEFLRSEEYQRATGRRGRTEDAPLPGRYLVPASLPRDPARTAYWNLMNKVRGGIHYPSFTVPEILKRRL